MPSGAFTECLCPATYARRGARAVVSRSMEFKYFLREYATWGPLLMRQASPDGPVTLWEVVASKASATYWIRDSAEPARQLLLHLADGRGGQSLATVEQFLDIVRPALGALDAFYVALDAAPRYQEPPARAHAADAPSVKAIDAVYGADSWALILSTKDAQRLPRGVRIWQALLERTSVMFNREAVKRGADPPYQLLQQLGAGILEVRKGHEASEPLFYLDNFLAALVEMHPAVVMSPAYVKMNRLLAAPLEVPFVAPYVQEVAFVAPYVHFEYFLQDDTWRHILLAKMRSNPQFRLWQLVLSRAASPALKTFVEATDDPARALLQGLAEGKGAMRMAAVKEFLDVLRSELQTDHHFQRAEKEAPTWLPPQASQRPALPPPAPQRPAVPPPARSSDATGGDERFYYFLENKTFEQWSNLMSWPIGGVVVWKVVAHRMLPAARAKVEGAIEPVRVLFLELAAGEGGEGVSTVEQFMAIVASYIRPEPTYQKALVEAPAYRRAADTLIAGVHVAAARPADSAGLDFVAARHADWAVLLRNNAGTIKAPLWKVLLERTTTAFDRSFVLDAERYGMDAGQILVLKLAQTSQLIEPLARLDVFLANVKSLNPSVASHAFFKAAQQHASTSTTAAVVAEAGGCM